MTEKRPYIECFVKFKQCILGSLNWQHLEHTVLIPHRILHEITFYYFRACFHNILVELNMNLQIDLLKFWICFTQNLKICKSNGK